MRTFTLVAMTALLLGTIAAAQNVTYDYDKSADFDGIRTYAWVRGTTVEDPLNHKRIVDAVNNQLAARELRRVEASARPDVLVAYHASFDRDLEIVGFASGWGGYRFGGTRSGSARAEEILVGTLAVDIVNASSKTILWRAMASKDIDVKASPEKREKNIIKTVDKLFSHYPIKRRTH
jgi:hypothetical protein